MFYLFVSLIDLPISRLTKGTFIPSAQWNIMPIIYLTTIGAKSGIAYSIPVLSIIDGDNRILIGSNWGSTKNPNWIYNLRAHPQARVRKGKIIKDFLARELHGNERAVYWKKAVTFYPPYTAYEKHSGRSLPIFLLEPIE